MRLSANQSYVPYALPQLGLTSKSRVAETWLPDSSEDVGGRLKRQPIPEQEPRTPQSNRGEVGRCQTRAHDYQQFRWHLIRLAVPGH